MQYTTLFQQSLGLMSPLRFWPLPGRIPAELKSQTHGKSRWTSIKLQFAIAFAMLCGDANAQDGRLRIPARRNAEFIAVNVELDGSRRMLVFSETEKTIVFSETSPRIGSNRKNWNSEFVALPWWISERPSWIADKQVYIPTGVRIDGLIGQDALRSHNISYDPMTEMLTVIPRGQADINAVDFVLDLEINRQGIFTSATVNGTPFKAKIRLTKSSDLGLDINLLNSLPEPASRHMSQVLYVDNEQERLFEAESRLFTELNILGDDLKFVEASTSTTNALTLGWLNRYAWTLDVAGKKLYLTKRGIHREPGRFTTGRIFSDLGEQGFLVQDVGEKGILPAYLLPGDIIQSVNSEDVTVKSSSWLTDNLLDMAGNGGTVTVLRDGKPMRVSIPPNCGELQRRSKLFFP